MRLRPARFVTMYSHGVSLFAQRPHIGLTLLHLTLEDAQAWQLSRSTGWWVGDDTDSLDGAESGNTSEECEAAIIEVTEQARLLTDSRRG